MRRTTQRLLLLLLAAAALAVGFAVATAVASAPLALTGYLLPEGFQRALRTPGRSVSDLGVDGSSVLPSGAGIAVEPAARDALHAAQASDLPASLLVSNYDNRVGDFSPAIAGRLLRSPANRAAVAAALAAEVGAHGWNGVTVDLEALAPADRPGLVAFLAALRERLPAPVTIDIDVPSATSPDDESWAPFDLAAIVPLVDHVVVMAYDQHYQGGTPGPIAGYPWVRRVLRTSLGAIPAARLRLGVAGYGYLWRRGRPTVDLSDAQARRLAGNRGRWSARQREWYARLPGGGVLWWSDARSVGSRLRLAQAAGLQGAALWRLGSIDRIPG